MKLLKEPAPIDVVNISAAQVREDADGPWRFTLLHPVMFHLPIRPTQPISNEWVRLSRNGLLIVNPGFAWDGCSIVGDGPRGSNGLPITSAAALLHDVCYQFLIDAGIYSRAQADRMFYDLLRQAGFAWSWLYYAGVRLVGGIYHAWGREPAHQPPEGT